jgi:hypothetical protein
VQAPGQVFQECQVRPAMAKGVRVEDDGPKTSPDLKTEAKVGGRGAARGLGWWHDHSMACLRSTKARSPKTREKPARPRSIKSTRRMQRYIPGIFVR